jgi:hypothetical protein
MSEPDNLIRRLESLRVVLGIDSPETRGWAPAVQQQARRTISDAIERLRAMSEPTEYCWLVELFDIGGNSRGDYHTGFTDLHHYPRTTKDPHQARRFGKEQAEKAAAAANVWMKAPVEWRAIEHGFG